MSNQTKGFSFALTSAVLYGLIPILGKIFVHNFHPIFVAFILTLIVGLYFAVITLWRKDLQEETLKIALDDLGYR